MSFGEESRFFGSARKDASKAHGVLEATFVWFCGQFSGGRTQKKQKTGEIGSDGANKTTQEKTVLGR